MSNKNRSEVFRKNPVKQKLKIKPEANAGWLIFFYTVPAKPVSSRMKVWRKLMKNGAVQLKGSVYILPFSDDHYEFLQWLASEVAEMKGEAGFVSADKIETSGSGDIISLFNTQRSREYESVEKRVDELEMKINSIRKGGKLQNVQGMSEQFNRLIRDFEETRRIDFFSSRTGEDLKKRIDALKVAMISLPGVKKKEKGLPPLKIKKFDEYQDKVWVTRKRPFVDRMASAWLIQKFIDKKAVFGFIDESETEKPGNSTVVFDIRNGEFTHSGDMCTFEVLVKSFRIKDRIIKKIAEIVHELDMKDGKYKASEAEGIEGVLTGIRKTEKNDAELLKKGMAVFEMLYASKAG